MPDFYQIKVSVSGKVGILQLSRPEARNALSETMLTEMRQALETWEGDRAIAAMVITGDERAFCAGGDLKAAASSSMSHFDRYRYRHTAAAGYEFMRFLGHCTKPVIAAVEGYALGGGLEIMLRCDFAVGSDTARIGLTEAKHGLFSILGGAWSLARAIGEPRARELAYTGRLIDPDEALSLGLFNHLTPAGGALDKALEIAEEIAASAPLSVMAIKQAINRAHSQSFEEALATGGDLSALLMFSEDRREGLAAFAERRDPNFKGE